MLLRIASLTEAVIELDRLRGYVAATNAHSESANASIKHSRRTGRGYRNPAHYRARIPLDQDHPDGSVNTHPARPSPPGAKSQSGSSSH